MDVKLPDGRVLRGVPDGTTKAQLAEKLQRNGIKVPQEWMTPPAEATQQEAPKEDPSLLSKVGTGIKNTAQTVGRVATGIPGGIIGDVAGLGATAYDITANAIMHPLSGSTPGEYADAGKVRDSVANFLTYQPEDPESLSNQVADVPGKVISGAGEGLVKMTGTEGIPVVENIVQALPLAAASLAGVRGPKAAAVPKPKVAAVAAKEMTPEQLHASAVEKLLSEDIRLTTEQRGTGQGAKQAGSIGRAADTFLGKSKLAGQQLQDFTRAVFRKVGLKADNATPDSMGELKRSSTLKYETAHNGVIVKVDNALVKDLNDLKAIANRNPDVETRFDKMLDHIQRNTTATANGVEMTAEALTEIRAELGHIEGSANSSIKHMAGEVKDALDAAAERSATPQQAAAMKEARRQYHFMRQIEEAVDKTGGFISPKKLINVISRKRNKNEAIYGMGDQELVELARAGAKVLPESVGNSGTATRAVDVLKAAAAFSHPVTAIKTAGALAGGRLINEASPLRGTASAVAAETKKKAAGTNPVVGALRVGTAITGRETEEQKKRRLSAEALRR